MTDESMALVPSDEIEADALFLSNAAELREGMLFVLGGGWTRCWPAPGQQEYPYERPVSVSALIRIPWSKTNEQHAFQVRAVDGEMNNVSPVADGQFSIGRPADLRPGMSQIVPISLTFPVKIESAGIFNVELSVDGRVIRSIAFEALERQPS